MSFDDKPYPDAPALELFQKFKDDPTTPGFQRDSASALVARFTEFTEKYAGEYPLLSKINLSQIPKGAIKKYIGFLQELELVGKTINNHLWTLSKVMARVAQDKKTTFLFDPEELRVKQVKNESEKYKPLTFEEKDAVFSFFRNHEKEYYRNYLPFLFFQYYSCIRPAEIMRLQLKYINLKERTIDVPWYKAKNGLSNYVQILDPLYSVLSEMKLEQFNQEDFLFSHRFYPGSIKKTSKNVSELWLIAVKDLEIIDKQMYGLKHTFNRDYVEKQQI